MKGAKAVSSALDRLTHGARARAGTTHFLLGSAATSDRLLSRLYFEAASRQWGGFATQDDHLAPFVEALKGLPPGGYARILDLGTGAGGSAGKIAEMMPEAAVIAVDRSRRMIAEARLSFRSDNLTFETGDATGHKWPAGSFDLVTAHNFIPHPPHVRRLLGSEGLAITSSTYQPLSGISRAVWEQAGFELVRRDGVGTGSFEMYRRL
jgi:SAM-dependent methyltransferase